MEIDIGIYNFSGILVSKKIVHFSFYAEILHFIVEKNDETIKYNQF